jgi:hypothetical protein
VHNISLVLVVPVHLRALVMMVQHPIWPINTKPYAFEERQVIARFAGMLLQILMFNCLESLQQNQPQANLRLLIHCAVVMVLMVKDLLMAKIVL